MNRRSASLAAGVSALAQGLLLFGFEPTLRFLVGHGVGHGAGMPQRDLRLFGLDLDGFAVRDTGHLGGWLPQVAFVVLAVVLTYAVLRAAPGSRPRWGTVWSLIGVLLLTAGVVDVLSLLTGIRPGGVEPSLSEWVGGAHVDVTAGLPAQFALCFAWLPVLTTAEVRLLSRWPVFHGLLGQPDGEEAGVGGMSAPATIRGRLDVVAAGLIPAVLPALAGGQVLRHTNIRHTDQTSSVTFAPELWLPYRPPDFVREMSGVLYPALRVRPLPTEETAGWLATCAVCLVFLAVLAAALYALAVRAGGRRPLRTVMDCWFATLLAAVGAAFVESGLLQGEEGAAPRPDLLEDGHTLTTTVGDAVRFGACWGWAVGVAFLVAMWALSRRAATADTMRKEGRLSHAG